MSPNVLFANQKDIWIDILNEHKHIRYLAVFAMASGIKLVDYSDSDSDNDESPSNYTDSNSPTNPEIKIESGNDKSIQESKVIQIAIVEPTPQQQSRPSSSDDEDLDGTGIFDAGENDPLSTQATAGSSPPNPPSQDDPYYIPPEIAQALDDVEQARDNEEVIVISDDSQGTVILTPPRNADEHMSCTTGKCKLLIQSQNSNS